MENGSLGENKTVISITIEFMGIADIYIFSVLSSDWKFRSMELRQCTLSIMLFSIRDMEFACNLYC